MLDEDSQLIFPRLDPPAGGLTSLRQRLEADRSDSRYRTAGPRRALGAAAAVALVVCLAVGAQWQRQESLANLQRWGFIGDPNFDIMSNSQQPHAQPGLSVENTLEAAAMPVGNTSGTVMFYWVESTASGDD